MSKLGLEAGVGVMPVPMRIELRRLAKQQRQEPWSYSHEQTECQSV